MWYAEAVNQGDQLTAAKLKATQPYAESSWAELAEMVRTADPSGVAMTIHWHEKLRSSNNFVQGERKLKVLAVEPLPSTHQEHFY